jgi:hypothetical protein
MNELRHWAGPLILDVRLPLGIIAFGYAAYVVWNFARNRVVGISDKAAAWHLAFWTLAPPLWFSVEWWACKGALGLKDGQEVAKELWAAVLAVILYFYPGGPLERIGNALATVGKEPQPERPPNQGPQADTSYGHRHE